MAHPVMANSRVMGSRHLNSHMDNQGNINHQLKLAHIRLKLKPVHTHLQVNMDSIHHLANSMRLHHNRHHMASQGNIPHQEDSLGMALPSMVVDHQHRQHQAMSMMLELSHQQT
jgi:hypothetical protein